MSTPETTTATAGATETLKLQAWDPSVYYQEIMRPIVIAEHDAEKDSSNVVTEENFSVTTKALTTTYSAISSRLDSYFDIEGFQPSVPIVRPLSEKRKLYKFTLADGYPPHLDHKNKQFDDDVPLEQIFDKDRAAPVKTVVRANINWLFRGFSMLPLVVPNIIKDFKASESFVDVETYNTKVRSKEKIWSQPNIGDRPKKDWYTDAVFAQQQFTGTNPKAITLASKDWIQQFKWAAQQQKNHKITQIIEEAGGENLYIQDCSYFRKAVGINDGDVPLMEEGGFFGGGNRYCSATVSLFHLDPKGRLHPLSIVIDYKGSMDKSVTIFNRRISPDNQFDESKDWPWRYAKTCAQSADWVRHEIASHLVHAHLVEEVTIVAAHRNLPGDHLLFRLLQPHWYKTLSLNAGARATLVPKIIIPLMGMTHKQATALIRYSFENFDFQGEYIPIDLERRGFPLDKLDNPQYHNYAYARNMKLMWDTLRAYVKAYLAYGGEPGGFTTDKQVADDAAIQAWCMEIRSESGGRLTSFPIITTLDDLIDAVTMCVHIASPQHTAINYLQEYYQSFVVNKPPALCSPLPTTLEALKRYREADVLAALPVSRARAREWLLASHVPNLLSMRVAEEQNLVNYARSVHSAAMWNVKDKPAEIYIAKAAKQFLRDMWVLGDTFDPNDEKQGLKKGIFTKHSEELDDQDGGGYMVMDPVATAVSILI